MHLLPSQSNLLSIYFLAGEVIFNLTLIGNEGKEQI